MFRLGVVAMLAAAVAAAVSPERSQAPSDEIVVTRDSISLPAGCTPRQVASLLMRFTTAFNRGDRAALTRLFPEQDPPGRAREPDGTAFRWYSVTEVTGRTVAFYDLKDLFPYFARRHLQGERLRLLSVDVGPSSRREAVGIGYALRREANDLPPNLSPYAHGKGEIDCRRQRIYVWSMGHGGREPVVACPRPADWTPVGPVLACARSGSAPNAQELAADFALGATRVPSPKRCGPSAVRARVESMLRTFNLGEADRFARGFAPAGQFHPYTGSISGVGFVGRPKIAAFARKRYVSGDGWTAIALQPPSGNVGLPERAVYQLMLRITTRTVTFAEGGAKLVVDCRSGLVTAWIGPGVRQPG